jgi:hypothetical protein
MSKNDLLEAYTAGLIGRREFIRGLVTLGASVTAAAAYAVALRPATEASAAPFYNPCPTFSFSCLLEASRRQRRARAHP